MMEPLRNIGAVMQRGHESGYRLPTLQLEFRECSIGPFGEEEGSLNCSCQGQRRAVESRGLEKESWVSGTWIRRAVVEATSP